MYRTYRLAIALLLSLLLGVTCYKSGFKKGFSQAEAEGVAKNIRITKQIMSACSEDNARMYNAGESAAEYVCDQRLRVNDTVCKMDLEKAYSLGQKDGMKRIGKLCGIKIK